MFISSATRNDAARSEPLTRHFWDPITAWWLLPVRKRKDSKRFLDTSGWGYAVFDYDAASDAFSPDANGGPKCGCHTIVKAKDYIFTAYPKR